MLTLFLVFIITKGALTPYEGNTVGRGAVRVGTQHSLETVRSRRYSENLNVSVLCPLLQISGSHAISILLPLRTKLLKQVK